MRRWTPFRRALGAVLFLALLVAAFQAGCGSDGDGSTFTPGAGLEPDATIGPPPPDFGTTDGGGGNGDADPDATLGVLDVTPATVTINLVIANGVPTPPPQPFTATYNGQSVPATWLFDRGELGDIDTAGVFKASGANVGEGTITARYGAREGTAKVKIVLSQTQNGAPTYPGGQPDGGAGFGGLGGVGGDPLGGTVDPAVVTKLKGTPTAPANDCDTAPHCTSSASSFALTPSVAVTVAAALFFR